MSKKIGLFFGSFNPIHVGHMILANHLAETSDMDELWFVVSPHNPHKEKSNLLDDYHRMSLVRVAVEDNPKLKASNVEFDLPKPSYTVFTLQKLKELHPNDAFVLIMGEDNLRTLHKWKNYEYILEHHKILVYPRMLTPQELKSDDNSENEFESHINVTVLKDVPMMKISSSFIRNAIKEGRDVQYMLTHKVFTYLDEMNFYK